MKSILSRLEAIETDLTPKHVVMAMLERMSRFNDLDSFLAWAYTEESLAAMDKTRENMYEAVKRRVKSKNSREINRACRQANREFDLLHDLATVCTLNVDREHYHYLYLAMVMTNAFKVSIQKHISEDEVEMLLGEKRQFKQAAQTLFFQVASIQLLAEALSRKYFEGKPLLMADQQALLGTMTRLVTNLVEDFNADIVIRKERGRLPEGWEGLLIDLEGLQKIVQESIPEVIEDVKQDARIALYYSEGQLTEAGKLMQRKWTHPKASK